MKRSRRHGSPPEPDPEWVQQEISRVLSLVRITLRALNITARSVEDRLGQSYGYLSRVLSGTIELKVSHLVEIAHCIGLEPAELVRFLFPPLRSESETAKRLREVLAGFQSTDS